jgi:acyl carrier protein
MTIAERIKNFIVTNYYVADVDALTDSASFLDRGLIDSTGVLELVGFVEDEFGVSVQDDDIVPDNFDSIQNLAAYVARRQQGAP